MKVTRPGVVLVIFTAIMLSGCKSNSIKEKLVRTWKLAGMGGKGADRFPDSIKQQMMGTRFMQFTDKGEMIATGGNSRIQQGEFTLSDDGKTLFTKMNNRVSDTMLINKLTPDTLIVLIKKAGLQLTWIPE